MDRGTETGTDMLTDTPETRYTLAVLFVREMQRRLRNGSRIYDAHGNRLRSVHDIVNATLAGTYPVEKRGGRYGTSRR